MKFLFQSLKNAFENFSRNKLVNFLSLGIISFTLLVLGIFNMISINLNRYISRLSEDIEAIFYIRDSTQTEQTERLIRQIEESMLIKEIRYYSRDEARNRFAREFPELAYILSEFKSSPFPASVEVKFRESPNAFVQIESFLKEVRRNPCIESVQLNTDWAEKIDRAKKFIGMIGLFLSFILIFVSVFIIFNVIKLNIFYRQDEIRILKLVGATDLYIRMPFLIEGCLLGLIGGIMAGFLLFSLLRFFSLYGGAALDIVRQVVDVRAVPMKIYYQLVAAGPAVGLFSSLLSLKKFLKIKPS